MLHRHLQLSLFLPPADRQEAVLCPHQTAHHHNVHVSQKSAILTPFGFCFCPCIISENPCKFNFSDPFFYKRFEFIYKKDYTCLYIKKEEELQNESLRHSK